jgi:hypothetical protein
MSDIEAPFSVGDEVMVAHHRITVSHCWMPGRLSSYAGRWRVMGVGTPNKSNPKGRYMFDAADARILNKASALPTPEKSS